MNFDNISYLTQYIILTCNNNIKIVDIRKDNTCQYVHYNTMSYVIQRLKRNAVL